MQKQLNRPTSGDVLAQLEQRVNLTGDHTENQVNLYTESAEVLRLSVAELEQWLYVSRIAIIVG